MDYHDPLTGRAEPAQNNNENMKSQSAKQSEPGIPLFASTEETAAEQNTNRASSEQSAPLYAPVSPQGQEENYYASAETAQQPHVHDHSQQSPYASTLPPQGDGKEKREKKPSSMAKRMVALGLGCALLGGLGGGLAGSFFASGGSTELQVGERTPVQLNTVSVNTREQLTASEVYANYIDSCVGITVDIVTTNGWGIPVSGAAAGSGFVLTQDGYIMTNYHVVDGAKSIKVSLANGQTYEAKYIGGDQESDIAVIKVEATGLKPVILGDSSKMYVGESVLTIGNPLGELTFSLSDGVVSALDRPITVAQGQTRKMIQTNTTINSGNSGGPLFNLYGEVIGVVTAKYSSSASALSGGASVEGLGFAIPISDVKDMVDQIISQGYVSKPYMGVSVSDVPSSVLSYGVPEGAVMVYVSPQLAGGKAGLAEGDVVTAVGDTTIKTSAQLIEEIGKYAIGDEVKLSVFRGGETLEVSVKLEEKTNESLAIYEEYAAKREAEEQQSQMNRGGASVLPFQ